MKYVARVLCGDGVKHDMEKIEQSIVSTLLTEQKIEREMSVSEAKYFCPLIARGGIA